MTMKGNKVHLYPSLILLDIFFNIMPDLAQPVSVTVIEQEGQEGLLHFFL